MVNRRLSTGPLADVIAGAVFVALFIALAISLGGCQTLSALGAANRALVPELLPADLRIHSDITCGDVGKALLAAMGPNVVSAPQLLDVVETCERRDDSMTLKVNPQAARAAFTEALKKPLINVSPGP